MQRVLPCHIQACNVNMRRDIIVIVGGVHTGCLAGWPDPAQSGWCPSTGYHPALCIDVHPVHKQHKTNSGCKENGNRRVEHTALNLESSRIFRYI